MKQITYKLKLQIMKQILFFALMVSMLAFAGCASGNDEDNTVVPIPDPAFKAYLLEWFDANHNGEISFTEAKKIVRIYRNPYTKVNFEDIKSVEGIEYFTELESLEISDTQLTSIDVSKNEKLKILKIGEMSITELDVSKNINMTELVCYRNNLTTLDVSNNINLVGLSCSFNKLTELDLSKNILLKHLDCACNQLTYLNLIANINLEEITCFTCSVRLVNLFLIQGHNYVSLYASPDTNIVYL